MATTRRVGVPVTEAQEQELEVFLPILQSNPELWDKVMIDMVGHVTHQALRSTIGFECRAPSSMPQLLASAAAIGLRQLQRAAIDNAYDKGWSELDAAMRPSIEEIQARSSLALAELDRRTQSGGDTDDSADGVDPAKRVRSAVVKVPHEQVGGLQRNPRYRPNRVQRTTVLAFG